MNQYSISLEVVINAESPKDAYLKTCGLFKSPTLVAEFWTAGDNIRDDEGNEFDIEEIIKDIAQEKNMDEVKKPVVKLTAKERKLIAHYESCRARLDEYIIYLGLKELPKNFPVSFSVDDLVSVNRCSSSIPVFPPKRDNFTNIIHWISDIRRGESNNRLVKLVEDGKVPSTRILEKVSSLRVFTATEDKLYVRNMLLTELTLTELSVVYEYIEKCIKYIETGGEYKTFISEALKCYKFPFTNYEGDL